MKTERLLSIGLIALFMAGCAKGNEATQPSASAPRAKSAINADTMKKMGFHGKMENNSSAGAPAPQRVGFHGNIRAAAAPGTSAPMAPSPGAPETRKLRFHGDMQTDPSAGSPILKALKANHLKLSSTKTIGEVFDGYKYAAKKEWRETATQNGPYYIDYICWLNNPTSSSKAGIAKQGLNVKFAIHRDGQTYVAMASRIDMTHDGRMNVINLYPPETEKHVTAIYENREITF